MGLGHLHVHQDTMISSCLETLGIMHRHWHSASRESYFGYSAVHCLVLSSSCNGIQLEVGISIIIDGLKTVSSHYSSPTSVICPDDRC